MKTTAFRAAGAAGARTSIPWERVIGLATGLSVLYLVGTPLFMLLFSSVRGTRDRLPFEATDFTADNYTLILSSPDTYRLLGNTLTFAVGAVFLSLALAVGFSYVIERTNIPFRSLALLMVLGPMALPPFVAAFAWILLANPRNGILNILVRGQDLSSNGPLDVYSLFGMILVTGTIILPSIYVMISGTFARMDPALEEASRLSGVGIWQTVRRITLPLLRPGIIGAAIFYFIAGVEIFEIPALLGVPGDTYVLSTWIFYLVRRPHAVPDYGVASGYAVLVIVVAGILIYFYGRAIRKQDRFVTVTGRGYRSQLVQLGAWRYVLFGLIVAYFSFAVVLPFSALIWKSLVSAYADVSLTSLSTVSFDRYVKAITSSKILEAAKNTGVISVVTATSTMTLASLVAWLSIRSGFRHGSVPDRLTFVAQGIPSIVVALAVMFLYIAIPLPIYATIWVIVIAMGTRFIPYGARVMHAGYLQLHRELEEASWTSGVAWWWTMVRIVLPLIWPSFLRGWLWMFVHAIRDATIPLMLISVGNATISTEVWFIWWDAADLAYASAISVLLMVVSSLLTYFVARQTLLARDDRGR